MPNNIFDSIEQCSHNNSFDTPEFDVYEYRANRKWDAESDDVIRLNSARAFQWYASRAAILNI